MGGGADGGRFAMECGEGGGVVGGLQGTGVVRGDIGSSAPSEFDTSAPSEFGNGCRIGRMVGLASATAVGSLAKRPGGSVGYRSASLVWSSHATLSVLR